MALHARHTSSIVGLTQLASLVVPQSTCADSLDHVKTIRVTELDFRVPKRAIGVYPVVVCSTLKRLAGNEWSTFLLLANSVLFSGDLNEFPLHTFFLSIPVALLLMCDFGLLEEV